MISEKKQTISRKFSRAAETYDSFSHVQKQSAAHLAETLSPSCVPAKILELGCGTGNYTSLLRQKYPASALWAIDFSQAMVDYARGKLGEDTNLHFLCMDGEEFLASRKSQYDLITSNATLQWFDDLDSSFCHAAAILSAHGVLHISLFGPQTLSELSVAFKETLQENIDLPASFFAPLQQIKNSVEHYFKEVRCEEQCITRQYDSLPDLLRHIQKTGAGGFQHSMPVLTKSRLVKINDWFVARGGHAVTYQVFYLMASQPLASTEV